MFNIIVYISLFCFVKAIQGPPQGTCDKIHQYEGICQPHSDAENYQADHEASHQEGCGSHLGTDYILCVYSRGESNVSVHYPGLLNSFLVFERLIAHGAMGRQIDPSWGGPIELFLVPTSAPLLV